MSASRSPVRAGGDVLVVGGGLIGLAVADALAARGSSVTLVSEARPGESSAAGAGMLAATVEAFEGPALSFAVAARDRFPDYLLQLRERTGVEVHLDREGILVLAHDDARAEELRVETPGGVRWLEAAEVAEAEPALAPVVGARFHPRDGSVDNVAFLHALERAVAARREIRRIDGSVEELHRDPRVRLADGEVLEAGMIVLAAGAWSARLDGLPRPVPVEPARGQMISVGARAPRHVVFSEHAYLVPRPDGRVLVGATMERVGFDASTTPEALARLREEGGRVVPALAEAPLFSGWAGLRPMTPDGLPILGADPDRPTLLYACGHSRNGILMAPLTGDCVAALVHGEEPPHDLSAFSIARFGGLGRSKPGDAGSSAPG